MDKKGKDRIFICKTQPEYVYKVVSDWNYPTQSGRSSVIYGGAYSLKYEMNKRTYMIKNTLGIFVYPSLKALYESDLISIVSCTLNNGNTVPLRAVILKCVYYGKLRCIPQSPDIIIAYRMLSVQDEILNKREYQRLPKTCISNVYTVPSIRPIKYIGARHTSIFTLDGLGINWRNV